MVKNINKAPEEVLASVKSGEMAKPVPNKHHKKMSSQQ